MDDNQAKQPGNPKNYWLRLLAETRQASLTTIGFSALYVGLLRWLAISKPPAILDQGSGTIYAQPEEAARAAGFVILTTVWLAAIVLVITWQCWRQRAELRRSILEAFLAALVPAEIPPLVLLLIVLSPLASNDLVSGFLVIAALVLGVCCLYFSILAGVSRSTYLVVGSISVAAGTVAAWTFFSFAAFCC